MKKFALFSCLHSQIWSQYKKMELLALDTCQFSNKRMQEKKLYDSFQLIPMITQCALE